MDWHRDLLLPIASNVIGVFVGVVLALWSDRRRQHLADAKEVKRLSDELNDLREVIVSSVIKATLEAMRVKSTLSNKNDPLMLEIHFELAVWEAAHSQFVRLAPLDDRILFSRFFDQVRRLARLVDFHRGLLANRDSGLSSSGYEFSANVAKHLAELAEDVRLDGVIVVSDHGDATQKRILGL